MSVDENFSAVEISRGAFMVPCKRVSVRKILETHNLRKHDLASHSLTRQKAEETLRSALPLTIVGIVGGYDTQIDIE